MEINTIIGIVVAIIICIVGLKMIFRKSDDATPSLETELHINEDSNTPVIPRHVRHQLQADEKTNTTVEPVVKDRIEPSLNDAAETQSTTSSTALETNISENLEPKIRVDESAQSITTEKTDTENQTETDVVETQSIQVDAPAQSEETPVATKEPEFVLNPNVQTGEIKDFDEESSILDVTLHEQQRYDDESTLANAETIIALNVYPNPRKALSGDKTLKVLLKYGLRFGEMRCFHRYEDPEKESPLMFSVLRITEQGPEGFDLETLSGEQVQGLAFFLALPHQNVQKGYDSMVSIAGLIARETDGTVYDENNLEFTPQLKEHWRHKAIDYRSGQEV